MLVTSSLNVLRPLPQHSRFKGALNSAMDQRRCPEYSLEVFADPQSVNEVVKGVLQTIFFHRFFPSIRPRTHEILDLSLPVVDDAELSTLISSKTDALMRQLDTSINDTELRPGSRDGGERGQRGQVVVQFFEKKRRKGMTWFAKGDDTVCWEIWTLDVTLATPRTENERAKVRRAMETTLLKTAMKIVTIVTREKDHIPPITVSETNPFPYTISVNPKGSMSAGLWR